MKKWQSSRKRNDGQELPPNGGIVGWPWSTTRCGINSQVEVEADPGCSRSPSQPFNNGVRANPMALSNARYFNNNGKSSKETGRQSRSSAYSSTTTANLDPLPLAGRVTEVVGTALGGNLVGNLLPLDLRQTLVISQ